MLQDNLNLAIAFAMEALKQGYTAMFITADDFANKYGKTEKTNRLQRIIRRYSRPDLLIVLLKKLGIFHLVK